MARDRETANAESVTSLWTDYERGRQYQVTSGMAEKLPMYVRFYDGDQWPKATKLTKNLPRATVNIVKMICRNKKSAILSTKVRIVYSADDAAVDVKKFNDFAEYIGKELGQERLDKRAVGDGVKKGSYFYHYYWDEDAEGKDGIREGALRCEIIDPLNIFFANPTETDEQRQKWIMIASREDVDSVRAKADPDVDPEDIRSDESEDRYGTVEQDGDRLVTVLTRYFRRGGEVFCEKATRRVVINRAFPITPDVDAVMQTLGGTKDGEDSPNNALPDDPKEKTDDLTPKTARATLYPVVAGVYEEKEGCIYGLGEVAGLIANQKAINFNYSMALLNDQEMAWGKYLVLPNALKGQTITNEPGQVIVDYSGTGNGVRKLGGNTMSSNPLSVVSSLTEMTRVVTGATEVMTGETLGAGMSGAAIAQLQAQAQMPVEELKNTFWLVKEKQGRVLAQFFKLFYAQKEYVYEETPEGGKTPERMIGEFSSSEYANVNFDVVVEATAGAKSSAAGDINMLDALLGMKAIDLKTYLKTYPRDALANRDELLRAIEERENEETEAMRAQLGEAQEQLKACAQKLEEQQKTMDQVNVLIGENVRLKQMLAKVYTEADAKIRESDRQIAEGNKKIAELTDDATSFAALIGNAMQAEGRGQE